MSVIDTVLRPVMRAWVAAVVDSVIAAIPRPADTPHVHADGHAQERVRVLVLGAGIAAGWGVLSHDLALPGSLARVLAASTGRGVDIDVVADVPMMARHAASRLRAMPLWRYQAIVLTLGINEAVTLTSARRWEADLRQTIDVIRRQVGDGVPIVIAGLQPVRSVSFFNSALGDIADRRATILNRVSERMTAEHPALGFAPLRAPIEPSDDRYGEPESYRVWAADIADVLVPLLAGTCSTTDGFRDEPERQAALDNLNLDAASAEPFDRLVALARRVFGTEAAAFSVIDGDHQWFKACSGFVGGTLPRGEGFCGVTIEHADGLMVPDLAMDDRFQSFDLVSRGAVRFYAGYPVTASGGEPVGALCVFDSQPRKAHDVDFAVLRHLARLVSDELEGAAVLRR